jgi:hypothetical protein
MSAIQTNNTQNLFRTSLWSRSLKTLLLDDLNAMKLLVRTLTDFPDGYNFNIPSLGEVETQDFVEGQAIKYTALDTGNFVFNFDNYKYAATSISEKFKRDSFYSSEVESAFLPREHRSLMEAVETNIFAKANAGQTASNLNTINTASHRWVASGSGQSITYQDFAKARYALTKANVPMQRLCAVVDPSVAYTLETQANVTNMLSPMPRADSILSDGLVSGFRFRFNLYGFDIYESNYLPAIASETINGVTVTNGVANLFFSATAGDMTPMLGGFRQMPTVYSEFNKDLQQTEYLTIAEWGFKLYREENMVIILTALGVVPA